MLGEMANDAQALLAGKQGQGEERMAVKKQGPHRSGGRTWFYKAGQKPTRPDD